MATQSSFSCLENPMEPGELQSMGLQRVGHDRATNIPTKGLRTVRGKLML